MNKNVIILGTGGHAKVIVDIFEEDKNINIFGFTTNDPALQTFLDYPIIGDDTALPRILENGVQFAFVAVGDNKIRSQLIKSLTAIGFSFINALSRKAVISRRVNIGIGVAVMPGAIINIDSTIGDGTIINTAATIDHDCKIDRFSHVAPGTNIGGNAHIGEGTFLGVGCSVVPEKSIGSWTVVGAGSVVKNDLPSSVIAVGVPAKIKKHNIL